MILDDCLPFIQWHDFLWMLDGQLVDFPAPKAHFKRRATAMPNSIDQIKFDFSTAVARRLKPSCATAVPNSIHKLQMH